MDTPVLLIHFNRPDSTRRQIEALRPVAPKRVWLLCDGPRAHEVGEEKKVSQVRTLLDNLPWTCEVRKLYRETNLGCFKSVSSGISWFLDECREGIILEDDILPDPSFFPFCAELLERFRDSDEVFAISGHHRKPIPLDMSADFGFSNYFECWGWATWKRAWDQFDPDITAWRDKKLWKEVCHHVLKNPRAALYWKMMFRRVADGRRDSWAYRYLLTIWKLKGRAVISKRNLTQNIGFNEAATQTAHFAGMEVAAESQPFPLQHPSSMDVDASIDRWFEDGIHSKSFEVRMQWLLRKIRARLK